MPTGERSVMGTGVIASAEDAAEDTITPRLIAAGANLKRIEIIRQVTIGDETRFLSLPRDLERVRSFIVDHGARILVIDPLNAFVEKGTDTYKDQDIRLVLGPMENIAEETGASIVIIAHLNKKEDAAILYRVGGSIGFIGAARSVIAVQPIPESEDCVLYSLKSNLARKPAALRYQIIHAVKERKKSTDWLGQGRVSTSLIEWKGETPDPSRSWDSPQKEKECLDFLKQELRDGDVPASVVRAHRKDVGLNQKTLDTYKAKFGVGSTMKGDKWYWVPPAKWPK
jgi:hypothetical protein